MPASHNRCAISQRSISRDNEVRCGGGGGGADGIDAPRVWGAGLDWLGRVTGEVNTFLSIPSTSTTRYF